MFTYSIDNTVILRAASILGLSAITVVCLPAEEANAPAPRPVIKTQGFVPYSDAPIHYRSQQLGDPIAKLEKRLESGEIVLDYDPKFGYLKSVLKALNVPASSQTLVFSKTSFQFPNITPATPRALYYNDDIYIGRVHNGKFLEFISFDPMQGAIFYILDDQPSPHPVFERSEVDCVQCHVAPATHGVPGVMLRSVYTKPSGVQAAGTPAFITGQESPINQRWGGWYVTARSGPPVHMGNVTVAGSGVLTPVAKILPATLRTALDTSAYLTDTSDIVAQLVLAHQTQMHNLITETNYKTRLALYAGPSDDRTDAVRNQFESPSEQLVRYMLFTNEAKLDAPIEGTSGFAEEFAARGPRDPHGRSLREFDLHKRIFKYPCSYLIYSADFDAIPEPAKQYIYRRLFEVLSGRDQSPEFASLSRQDRGAILEILMATKPGLPDQWNKFLQKAGQANSTALLPARFAINHKQSEGNHE
ncbi:MAG: hypothetical protein JO319_05750 [Acidobacteriaceae bacterium]|nr:hypothetical protein [Acidobacteriaceae bacterium]